MASARSSVTRPGIVEAMTAGEATQVLVTTSIHDLRRNLEAGEICTSPVDGVPINPQNVMNRLSGSALPVESRQLRPGQAWSQVAGGFVL